MAAVTMLAAGSFVLLAVASTGSARPWDWTRADPAAALRLCGGQGLGAVGCMLDGAFRPAAAATASAANPAARQPLVSVATVADQLPAAAPASTHGARPASSAKPAVGPVPTPSHAQHPVTVPRSPAPSPSPTFRDGGDD